MSLRKEFIELARLDGANIRHLARQFSISPTTAYKWLRRYERDGEAGLKDRSRRPLHSPFGVSAEVETMVVRLREKHPAWGARKLYHLLRNEGVKELPAPSTIHAILKRHSLIDAPRSQRDLQRFERREPNELWQMDFKGDFKTDEGSCYPFTTLDDHSRYSLGIYACASQEGQTVQYHLEDLFSKYGLPRAILCDNGVPWGSSSSECRITSLGVWLLRLGIDVLHGRPWHPQTQGKLERFHRSLKAEVLQQPEWSGHQQCQEAFDVWRAVYNRQRPHESLNWKPPASRYRTSKRQMPTRLPQVEYDEGVITRRVSTKGTFSFKNQLYYAGRGLGGYDIGIIPLDDEELYEIRFGWKVLTNAYLDKNDQRKGAATFSIWTS